MKKGLSAWAHFPIFLWVIGPLIVWPLARDEKTRFQIRQALAWQLLWTIVIGFLWSLAVLTLDTSRTVSFAIKVFAYLLAVIALAYSIYASYKCFEGEEFRYPLVSRLLAEGP